MNLPINLKILLTGLLKPLNYGKKSVVENIGPWSNLTCCKYSLVIFNQLSIHQFIAIALYNIYKCCYKCPIALNWSITGHLGH
jgi:hypothetical protein